MGRRSSNRVLGLDIGDKRIGVAASDPEQILASAVDTIHRRGLVHDIQALQKLVDEYEPGLIVVGLPLTLRGELGEQAQKVMKLAELIAEKVQVPIAYEDERLTTVAANRLMEEAGIRSKSRREKIDSVSAVLILQAYLDNRPRSAEDRT